MQTNSKQKKKITVYDLAVVGLMAALCYAGCTLRIEIPTPAGKAMIHMGNVFGLLAGLLFGGLRGGLSAGIGCCLFDLLNGWGIDAPSTFVNKFVMGFLAGWIPRLKGKDGKSLPLKILGAACGMYIHIALYLTYSFVKDLVLGSAIETAWSDVFFRMPLSLISGTLSLTVAVLLAALLHPALEKAGLYKKFA